MIRHHSVISCKNRRYIKSNSREKSTPISNGYLDHAQEAITHTVFMYTGWLIYNNAAATGPESENLYRATSSSCQVSQIHINLTVQFLHSLRFSLDNFPLILFLVKYSQHACSQNLAQPHSSRWHGVYTKPSACTRWASTQPPLRSHHVQIMYKSHVHPLFHCSEPSTCITIKCLI